MESTEIKNQLKMTYDELVDYLLKKYGPAQYDYFCNESCKSKNSKVSRTNEGLYCHHIDENKAISLANIFLNTPFDRGRHYWRVLQIEQIEKGTFKI